jgi:hypothetical protein
MIRTMFSTAAAPERVEEFASSVSEFHPAGFRVRALSLAEADLRAVLPLIDEPTLRLYGDRDSSNTEPVGSRR